MSLLQVHSILLSENTFSTRFFPLGKRSKLINYDFVPEGLIVINFNALGAPRKIHWRVFRCMNINNYEKILSFRANLDEF